MTTDVGFLATGLSPLKEAFGMEFGTGNPFALPMLTSCYAVDIGDGRRKGVKKPVDVETEKAKTRPSKESSVEVTRKGGKVSNWRVVFMCISLQMCKHLHTAVLIVV